MKRTMSHCPFCHGKAKTDTQDLRTYKCGTTADRTQGHYTRKCN